MKKNKNKKYCSHCGTTKGKFVKYNKIESGIQYYYCRKCNAEKFRNYYKKNKKKIKEIVKRYEKKNPEKRKLWNRRYYLKKKKLNKKK